MPLQNPKAFFDAVRLELFGGVIAQDQVDGINAILEARGTSPVTDWR
jgi:hypothetical protein